MKRHLRPAAPVLRRPWLAACPGEFCPGCWWNEVSSANRLGLNRKHAHVGDARFRTAWSAKMTKVEKKKHESWFTSPYCSVSQLFGLAAPSGKLIAICFKVWWLFWKHIFTDILEKALARGTPVYCKWHSGWEPLPQWLSQRCQTYQSVKDHHGSSKQTDSWLSATRAERALHRTKLVFFFWASCWNHCLVALDLGAGVEQPFNCLIVQDRQAM